MKGSLITFEGIDGAGKTLQIHRLSSHLTALGVPHVCTKQPGGTPLADEIRKILLVPREENVFDETELLLFAAARSQHIRKVVVPALSRGTTVLCDRFLDSVYAYQGGRGTSPDTIRSIYRIVDCGVTPDLTFLLDISPSVGLERISSGGHLCDRIESDRGYQERVRSAYMELFAQNPDRIHVVDGTLPVDLVTMEIVSVCIKRGFFASM